MLCNLKRILFILFLEKLQTELLKLFKILYESCYLNRQWRDRKVSIEVARFFFSYKLQSWSVLVVSAHLPQNEELHCTFAAKRSDVPGKTIFEILM